MAGGEPATKAGQRAPVQRGKQAVPRLALTPDEAAESLGVSRDFFDEWVKHEIRLVRRGRRRLIPVAELEAWLDREAEHPVSWHQPR